MKEILFLEKNLHIDKDYYDCTLDDKGNIISLSIYNSEYDELLLTDISIKIISRLSGLEELHLSCNTEQLSDLSPLSSVVTLKKIVVEEPNNVGDITSIESLFFLEVLEVSNGKITDISSLKAFPRLKVLCLRGNQIHDVNVIAGLTNLQMVDLSYNQISFLPDLTLCKEIASLNLSNNNLTDLNGAINSNELKHLILNSNNISDISFLNGKHHLISVYLSENEITDATCLAAHKNIKFLAVDNNLISDMSFLKHLGALETLSIGKNPAKGFTVKSFPKTLTHLHASFLSNFNTASIEHLHNIAYLYLEACEIEDLTFIKNFPSLRLVNLNNNQIQSASVFIENRNPTYIFLKNNPLQEPFPVYALYNPDHIDLQGNTAFGKQYLRYRADHSFDETVDSIDQLRQSVALYYLKHDMYDQALGFYYINVPDKTRLIIQIEKTKMIGNADHFYLNYNILTCIGWMFKVSKSKDDGEIERLKGQLTSLIDNSSIQDKLLLKNSVDDYTLYVNLYQNALLDFVDNYSDHDYPEIIYSMSLNQTTRDTFDKGLFLYKKLKITNHPFQYPVYHQLMKVLQMKFAYTDIERLLHNRYKYKLDHVLDCDILEVPYKDYLEYNHLLKMTGRSFIHNRDYRNRNILRDLIFAIIIVVIVIYILGTLN